MTELIAKIVSWVWNKLIVLVLIVFILLTANWIGHEWHNISSQLKEVAETERRLEAAEKSIEQLRKEANKLDQAARQQLEKINTEEQAMELTWKTVSQAIAAYEAADEQVKWWKPDKLQLSAIAERKAKHEAAKGLRKSAQAAQETLDALKHAQKNSPWAQHQRSIRVQEAKVDRLQNKRTRILNEAGKSPTQKLILATREVLPTALWVLVGIILSPVLIKGGLYFIIAPLISRTKPVVVLPETSGDVTASASAVSESVLLESNDQLLVHSNFLQAAGAGPGKKTRWLFSWRMPFTSIAAGLYMMVVVRNRGDEEAEVTISPKKDLFDKICDVRIPKGSAMVVYPRSLVGMVLNDGVAPKISRHWRLASLHSWVTFQFRYIVIHGECRLLLKGCRGVRAERVETTKPGMQDQLATLGFTSNLEYSGVRCETFIDYLLGRDELFNDKFSGANGYFFTEEVPNPKRKTGLFGRGLEGVIDGVLKAFGV